MHAGCWNVSERTFWGVACVQQMRTCPGRAHIANSAELHQAAQAVSQLLRRAEQSRLCKYVKQPSNGVQ